MTETLTESFCERCGTRYTFESSAPGQRRFGSLKVLGRGFKHFVMSDDSSLDESIAAARSDVDRDATNHQLDAFHRTFSFCMSCRQYTCANCWNEPEQRCLSCAPLSLPAALSVDVMDEVDPARLRRLMGEHDHAHHQEPPESATLPPIEAAGLGVIPELYSAVPAVPAVIDGMTAGQSIDDAIAAFEATHADVESAEHEVALHVPPAAQRSVSEAEHRAPAPTPEPEVMVTAEPVPAPAPAPEVASEPASVDTVTQPVWSVPPPPSGTPQWPTGPRWPTGIRANQSASAEQPQVDALATLMSRSSTDAMWAASSREIVRPVAPTQPVATIQPCANCGISLSATARFCRRCGTAQA